LLIAGDICPDVPGSGNRAHLSRAAEGQAAWLVAEFVPWLDRAPVGDIVMCWGNHDYVGEVPAAVPAMPGRLLTDEEVTVRGLRVYGTPWTYLMPSLWAFDVPSNQLEAMMWRIPAGIDVLVTHGPPRGVLDEVAPGRLAGSQALADAVGRTKPRLHVFGHIHEGRGQHGTSYNVSVLDERYQPYELPVTMIDI
jgi:Icc-related predicted phosphoesterase